MGTFALTKSRLKKQTCFLVLHREAKKKEIATSHLAKSLHVHKNLCHLRQNHNLCVPACTSQEFKTMCEVATIWLQNCQEYCGQNEVHGPLVFPLVLLWTLGFTTTNNLMWQLPLLRGGSCEGYVQPSRKCAIIDRNEQVIFHWICFICFPRVCDSCRTDTSPISLTSYQLNFPHSTNVVLFQDSFRRVYVSTRVRSSGFCSCLL